MSETFASSDTIEFKIGKNKIDGLLTGYYQINLGQTWGYSQQLESG